MTLPRMFACDRCHYMTTMPADTYQPPCCPYCGEDDDEDDATDWSAIGDMMACAGLGAIVGFILGRVWG